LDKQGCFQPYGQVLPNKNDWRLTIMNMVAVFDEIITRKPAASGWLAWACLMRQTLCFGKAEDDLSVMSHGIIFH
jgi:hypothetical protein